jgi:hypothetical protein
MQTRQNIFIFPLLSKKRWKKGGAGGQREAKTIYNKTLASLLVYLLVT